MHTTEIEPGGQSVSEFRQFIQETSDRIVVSPEEATRLLKINQALARNTVIRDPSVFHRAPTFYEQMTQMLL